MTLKREEVLLSDIMVAQEEKNRWSKLLTSSRQNIQHRSSTTLTEEESSNSRKRNPAFLKMLCTVTLSRNISAEMRPTFSSRATWTARRSNSLPRPCFW
jgi:hypothetical protein